MQKESILFFSFSNESIFGEGKDTIKRGQNKINMDLFLLSSVSIFGEARVRISEDKQRKILFFFNFVGRNLNNI